MRPTGPGDRSPTQREGNRIGIGNRVAVAARVPTEVEVRDRSVARVSDVPDALADLQPQPIDQPGHIRTQVGGVPEGPTAPLVFQAEPTLRIPVGSPQRA